MSSDSVRVETMSSEVAISLDDVGKCYPVFAAPADRLKQMVMPRLRRAIGASQVSYYREYWALRNVSCEIRRGEQVGILGRNGAGKSTLLQIVCGTLGATTGVASVEGRVAALLELGAGFNPEFTGRENVELNSTLLGMTSTEIADRFDDILAFADIGEFIDQPVKTYSSGMYMRLAFSVAIHTEPDILVVDEALAVGDEAFQRKCLARIARIRDRGGTILFVSHSAGMVTETCDRAMLLDGGRLLAIGKARSVVGAYQKLLFARPDQAGEIREDLQQQIGTPDDDLPVQTHAAETTEDAAQDDAHFDPALTSSAEVAYARRGVRILDPELVTEDGRRVNVLTQGREYIYRYRAVFEHDAVGVRCGMMIRSKGGVEIAGSVSAPEGAGLPHVAAGKTLDVRFRLPCDLLPSTYFLNAGVVALEGEEEVYLDRRVDVLAFRVQSAGRNTATGYVDLGCVSDVVVID